MTLLKWLERSMFVMAAMFAVWCSVTLIRAEYVRRLPIPEPAHRAVEARRALPTNGHPAPPLLQLPGDAGSGDETDVQAGAWLAKLEAPALGLMATVLEGSGDRVLARAAGHIEHTALPGVDGNVGIAGHRDTIFRPLQHARVGQLLRLTTADHVRLYAISSITIVDPVDVGVLAPTAQPTLTLVTCYPFRYFGSAPQRFIVRARLVESRTRWAGF